MYNRYRMDEDGNMRKTTVEEPKAPKPQKEAAPLELPLQSGDLMVLCALLLIASEKNEHRNPALLTLLLYFLMG